MNTKLLLVFGAGAALVALVARSGGAVQDEGPRTNAAEESTAPTHDRPHHAGMVLDPLVFATGGTDTERTQIASGHFDPGVPDWVYLPVKIPDGVRELAVSYSYDRPATPSGVPGNALDIGVFDESGFELANGRGFRGWSGGFRDSFTISRSEATPGYLPGPIRRGTWWVILGPYTVAPQGMSWSVNVTLRFGDPGPEFLPNRAPQQIPGRGRAFYRGDMHLHTVHSDGKRLPSELAAGARAARLDFIVSTEHNTSSADGVWGQYAGPDLLIINGEEITTRNGHYLALGLPDRTWIDWRYRAVDELLPRFLRAIHGAGALSVAAQPYCPFVGCAWKFGYRGQDAIEVWNGSWTADDEATVSTWDNLLVAADDSWIPAVGNSDAHREPQVIGLPHNVVLADALERGAILGAVRRGQLWIAESAAVDLTFVASAAGRQATFGERLAVPGDEPITITLTVTGADGAVARLITDQGQVFLSPLPAGGPATISWTTRSPLSSYVRAEIRRVPTSEMVALTNPIFLGR